ncbi:MAG: hypothetical protein KJ668_05560 [Proteobacteria bacterium]|nr:hypothetical protein [Pseudomonadota bacterium]MBU2629505.1 hypothetical protein [Pseudomonadota bacterium]
MVIRKTNISLEEAKKIHQYLVSGNSYKSACDIFGLTSQTIKTVLKSYGLEIKNVYKNRTAMPDMKIEQAVKLLKNGVSQQKVIREFKVNRKTLQRALKIKGITIDPLWLKNKITKGQSAQATTLFRNGLTYAQVSKNMGISKNSLHYHFTKTGTRKPATNFKLTQNQTIELRRLLKKGQDKKNIADRFDTTKLFISLSIVELGIADYFKSPKFKSGMHGLTEAKIREFINLKFKGEPSILIVKKLGTTKPTLYRMLSLIEAEFIKFNL